MERITGYRRTALEDLAVTEDAVENTPVEPPAW